MNTQTLTIQSSDGTCSGSVQISFNSFASCLGGTLSLSADQKTASITTVASFCVESSYSLKVKVTISAQDTQGNALALESISSTTFQTQQALVKVGVSGGSNIVNALAVSCNTLFVGGNFTTVGSSARNNIAAIDPLTGAATPWNPNGSGQVLAFAYNGTTLYVGGAFTTIGGQSRNRIAELDLTTGNATAWNPNASLGTINAIAYDATNVYLGGSFTSANIGGQTYTHLAAVSRSTGTGVAGWCPTTTTFPVSSLVLTGGVLFVGGSFNGASAFFSQIRNYVGSTTMAGVINAWDPNANNTVNAITSVGSALIIGGTFTTINGGIAAVRLAIVDATTGTLRP